MKIKVVIGDDDPWHLSWKPIVVFVLGAAGFCTGGFDFVWSGPDVKQAAAVIAGLGLMVAAGRAMARETAEQRAVLAKSQDEETHA